MIRLCYLYIKEFKCLKETDISLDCRYVFQYDKHNNVLLIKGSDTVPDNFWGPGVDSLTAIVGSNGAGKSTVLRQLLKAVTRGDVSRHPDIILAYINEDKKLEVYAGNSFKDLKIAEEGLGASIVNEPPSVDSILYRGHFYTYTTEDTWEGELGGECNLSEGWLLVKDIQNHENEVGYMLNSSIRRYLEAHINEDAWRVCSFMLKRHDWMQMENYNPPRYINIVPNKSGEVRLQNNEFSKYKNENLPDMEDLPPHFEQKDSRAEALEIFIEEGFKNLIVEFPDNYNVYREIWDDWLKGPQHNNAESLLADFERLINRRLLPLVDLQLKALIHVLHEINKASFKKTKGDYLHSSGIFYLDSDNVDGFKTIIENLQRQPVFATARFFDLFPSHFPGLSCDLSSGEREALNLLSRLYSALSPFKNEGKYPSLILIDEAETSFHPEWQRRYIELLTQFFNQVPLVPAGHRFQIIYTTHSPITLSDIPGPCVNYLKRNNETGYSQRLHRDTATFGSNVFDLYRDSFFMQDGLIGSFAADKIQQVFDKIESKHEIEKARRVIDLVGDRRIRHYLKSLLECHEED